MEAKTAEALAKRVSKHFLVNYYQVLHDTPELLHKFYQEDSVFSVGNEGQNAEIPRVVGPEQIKEKIQSLNFSNSRVRLLLVEAQATVAECVLIFVKGTMTNATAASSDFVQTFLLAPQEPSGYYVRNDILRYLAQAKATPAPAAQPEQKQTQTSEKKVDEAPAQKKEPEPTPAPKEHKVEATQEPPAAVSAPAQSAPEPKTESAPSKEETSTDEASGSEDEDEKEPESTPAPAQVPAPSKAPAKPEEKGTSSWAALAARAAPLQPKPAPRTAPVVQKKPKVEEQQHEQQPSSAAGSTSLYVSNLPYSCTRTQVDELFGVYGEIKVTALPANKKGFAFIEYVSPDSVLKAIKATNEKPITLEGRLLKVEQRKPKHGRDRQGRQNRNKDRKDGQNAADGEKDNQHGGEAKEKRTQANGGAQKQPRQTGGDRDNRPRGGGQKKAGGNNNNNNNRGGQQQQGGGSGRGQKQQHNAGKQQGNL